MSSFMDRWFHRSAPQGMPVPPEAPFSLTTPVHWLDVTPRESSDKPCTVRRLDVVARVCGLYAEVTQTLVIKNPNGRPISESLAIPLPDRAVVCGYALDIDGHMVDGVVVTQEKARVAFETEQRRGADPGLVEAVRGNVYRTRVYPVPSHGERTVMLRYVTPLMLDGARSATLDLPMPAEHLDARTLRIEVEMLDAPKPVISGIGNALMSEARGFWRAEAQESDLTPSEPVRVAMPELPASFALLERDEEGTVWFSASVQAEQPETEEPAAITALTVLWDASGSRADVDYEKELALLRSWCEDASITSIELVVFGDRVREVREFSSAKELVDHVRKLRYDGGTDLMALSHALEDMPRARAGIAQGSACVLFSDGLDTLSYETLELPEGCDVLAVLSGTERDAETLRQACGGLAVDLALAPQDAKGLARALDRSNPNRTLSVHGEGIADVCDAASALDARRAVIGRLTASETQITLGDGGATLTLRAEDAREGDVLARAWAARRVAQLSPRASEFADELLALGRRFGVASPVTSLIVLETLDQWLRHDIEPPKTWASMHERWVRAKEGEMRLSSEQARKERHRRELAGRWSQVLAWWSRDSEKKPDEVSRRERLASGHCPMCGSEVSPGMAYCPVCGYRLVDRDRRAPRYLISDADDTGSFGVLPISAAEPEFGEASMSDGPMDDLFEGLPDGLPDAMPLSASVPESMPVPRSRRASAAPRERAYPTSAPTSASAAPSRSRASASRTMAYGGFESDSASSAASDPNAVAVSVQAWTPSASYLKSLDKAMRHGLEAARVAYFKEREQHRTSPSFFLDCAGWFLAHDDEEFGICVLTNLAEMRIEDAALLRVLGWRLREAGRLERALAVLRHVLKLRGEDSQSHRDAALVLSELAREAFETGDEDKARAFANESGELYRKTALTPWDRRPMAIGLFAVEEYNVLRAWAEGQSWTTAPELPALGDDLEGVLACDLRITIAWDADETDVDLHVTEPSGEEAYYGHKLTSSGGRMSEDITDGYGPELYQIRHAQEGTYNIRAHYYASHQQTVFGPATCTLTVYTDWGKATQRQQITSVRLDREKGMTSVGTASYGETAIEEAKEAEAAPKREVLPGMSADEVREILGSPDDQSANGDGGAQEWAWNRGGRRRLIVSFENDVVVRVVERMPWGEEMLVAE